MKSGIRALAVAAAALTFSPWLVGVWGPIASQAAAEDADPEKEARRLTDEGRRHFRISGDTDLDQKERREARREAHDLLMRARKLLDDWLDSHPADEERFDSLYVEIRSMLFWIKKEASVGEFGPEREAPSGVPPTPAPPPAVSGAGAGQPGNGGSTAPPPEPEPEPDPAALRAGALQQVRDYESDHPSDVPGLYERYKGFLSAWPDTGTDEYAHAMTRLEALDQQLKDVYRLARDDDPDALENLDDAEVVKLVDQLVQDLEKGDEVVRVRAAKFLGAVGSGAAAKPLIEALERETSGPVYEAVVAAVAKIGGRRVCDRLLRIKPDSPRGPAVYDILSAMVRRGGVNARIAGEALAGYVAEMGEEQQHAATALLHEAGRDGALGLAMSIRLAPFAMRDDYIVHLGEMKDPRTAGYLASFMIVNAEGGARKQSTAARMAIQKMGMPAIRYLIPALDDERCAVWTAELLRQLSGEKLKDDKRKTWEKWYRKNRRRLDLE